MISNALSYLRKPSTYVIFFLGAIAALAVPAVRNLAAPIASKIPGAK